MNVLPALQHHLNQTTQHTWKPYNEPFDPTIHTTITTPLPGLHIKIITHIIITQYDNTLIIERITGPDNKITKIDLFDPNYLEKILQAAHNP